MVRLLNKNVGDADRSITPDGMGSIRSNSPFPRAPLSGRTKFFSFEETGETADSLQMDPNPAATRAPEDGEGTAVAAKGLGFQGSI
eukprot:CAMPEP_0196234376 /NCGR_PEP_ID=MMETSP0913-20130531/4494_1 /TAXON_ID=49265 /ORGANISM="Thalassiosira rotula, Strain GSO102" /LENGTH=85 /DNA_ID=CAMNT_0041515427 /DNA_START=209 /DNA_END=466 /DNA_ORIENTATION=-